MEEYLKSKGFIPDTTAPIGCNRWYFEDMCTYASVTLTVEGTTDYGFINKYVIHEMKYKDLLHKRKFEGLLTQDELDAFLDTNRIDLSNVIRVIK